MNNLTYVASPYGGDTERNHHYAVACMKDAYDRGEYAFAPHVMLHNVLDDSDPKQRVMGMEFALDMVERCWKLVLYTDLGVSTGMQDEIHKVNVLNQQISDRGYILIEFRRLANLNEAMKSFRRTPKPFPPYQSGGIVRNFAAHLFGDHTGPESLPLAKSVDPKEEVLPMKDGRVHVDHHQV